MALMSVSSAAVPGDLIYLDDSLTLTGMVGLMFDLYLLFQVVLGGRIRGKVPSVISSCWHYGSLTHGVLKG